MSGGWDVRSLSEVCTIKPPKAEARSKLPDTAPVSFVPMEDLGVGAKSLIPSRTRALGEVSGSYTYFADGDVLLAKITPCFENGKLGVARGLVNGIGFGSSEFIVLRPGPELEAEFLYYYLARASFVQEGARSMTGAVGHKRVAKEFIEAYPVPLPSRSEQRRIVAILDEAFEGIATAKTHAARNLRNAREAFNSSLDRALSLKGPGYVETTLGNEAEVLAGYAFPSKGYVAASKGVRLLRGDNIMQGYLRWEDAKAWPATDCAAYERFVLRAGDVVLAMDRPWVKAGLKRAQLGAEDLPSLLLQRTARLRPRGRMMENFLFRLTGSDSFSRHLLSLQTGIGVPHISGKQIESYRFALPPMDVQRNIALELDEMDHESLRLADNYQRKLDALDELKQSLLHQAFRGNL